MPVQLADLPEELLERILALVLAPRSSVWATPTTFLTRSSSTPSSSTLTKRPVVPLSTLTLRPPAPSYTPLLVCARLRRIGTPLLYAHLHLASPAQARLALRTLRARPALAACVRTLRVEGVWPCVLDLVQVLSCAPPPSKQGENLPRLECFDFCLDFHTPAPTLGPAPAFAPSPALDAFCAALALLPALGSVRRLTVRKAANAYLSSPGPAHVLEVLGAAVERWDALEEVTVTFALPSGPPLTATHLAHAFTQLHPPNQPPAVHLPHHPLPQNQHAPKVACARFVTALARAPGLRVMHAHLPAVWNTALLEISTNPALEALVLTPAPSAAHLFLAGAKRHARLYALIAAGVARFPPLTPSPHARGPGASPQARLYGGPLARARVEEGVGRVRANTTAGVRSGVPFPSASASASASTSARAHAAVLEAVEVEPRASSSSGPASRNDGGSSKDNGNKQGEASTGTEKATGLSRAQSKRARRRAERAARRISVV